MVDLGNMPVSMVHMEIPEGLQERLLDNRHKDLLVVYNYMHVANTSHYILLYTTHLVDTGLHYPKSDHIVDTRHLEVVHPHKFLQLDAFQHAGNKNIHSLYGKRLFFYIYTQKIVFGDIVNMTFIIS
jgi:hypothetical protein